MIKVESESPQMKRVEDHQKSEPRQLELFVRGLEKEERDYSNTIELYDFLPKYFAINGRKKDTTLPEVIKREFEFRGKLYELIIIPATIQTKTGQFIKAYPGDREEIIEDVLRKIASEQLFPFLDDIPSVKFSTSQIRNHLKAVKHSFSHAEIVQALEICVGTTLKINALDGSESYTTHMFQSLYLGKKKETRSGDQIKSVVRLNELVANSIKQNSFRRLNYVCLMSLKNSLARKIYKRLSHLYTYAQAFEPENSYSMLLSTMLRDFGLTAYADVRNNIRAIKKALNELQEKEVISGYKIGKPANPQMKDDVIFTLSSGYSFGKDMKAANYHHNANNLKLESMK